MNGRSTRVAAVPLRIAIVTPWFGPDLRGGSEQQSWQLAHHLARRGHQVTVLTTACASFTDDWSRNRLRVGVERRGPLSIRRFRTDRRDRRAFDRVNAILLSIDHADLLIGVPPLSDADADTFHRNGINSAALLEHLARAGHAYDRFIFLPYLYGPTLFGVPLVAERAYVQPCLHDEAYAYLGLVSQAIHAAHGLLFNSDGEFETALRLFGPGIVEKSTIVGEGVDVATSPERGSERVRDFVPANRRYVLYLGRQDPGKNVAALVAAFKAYRRREPATRLELVLAGESATSYASASHGIVDVGPVSEREKLELLAHCRALAQPSRNESFSRVIYEAWAFGRPVVVNARCAATATAVARSGGGFATDAGTGLERVLAEVDRASDGELRALGDAGRSYARAVGDWAAVIARYERTLAPHPSGNGHRSGAHSTHAWDRPADVPLMRALQDTPHALLYAGPLVSIDHVHRLLVVFLQYLTIELHARLTIAASAIDEGVFAELQAEIRRLDLFDRILLARDLEPEQELAIYRTARVFVALDANTFPAREATAAMWFDVPVVAVKSDAADAVVARAGIVIDDGAAPIEIAALVHLVVTDGELRDIVCAAQREARTSISTKSPAR